MDSPLPPSPAQTVTAEQEAITHKATGPGTAGSRRHLSDLLPLYRFLLPYRRQLWLAAVALVLAAATVLALGQGLRMLVDRMERNLEHVTLPTLLVQGTDDPVVMPESAQRLHDRLPSVEKRLHWVPSSLHGILYRDVGDTRDVMNAFLAQLDQPPSDQEEPRP